MSGCTDDCGACRQMCGLPRETETERTEALLGTASFYVQLALAGRTRAETLRYNGQHVLATEMTQRASEHASKARQGR